MKDTKQIQVKPIDAPVKFPVNIVPLPELIADKEAIRAAQWESRKRHTVKVRSMLP